MNKFTNLSSGKRLLSLDFFRGFTMFILIAEGTGLYPLLTSPELEGTFNPLARVCNACEKRRHEVNDNAKKKTKGLGKSK